MGEPGYETRTPPSSFSLALGQRLISFRTEHNDTLYLPLEAKYQQDKLSVFPGKQEHNLWSIQPDQFLSSWKVNWEGLADVILVAWLYTVVWALVWLITPLVKPQKYIVRMWHTKQTDHLLSPSYHHLATITHLQSPSYHHPATITLLQSPSYSHLAQTSYDICSNSPLCMCISVEHNRLLQSHYNISVQVHSTNVISCVK